MADSVEGGGGVFGTPPTTPPASGTLPAEGGTPPVTPPGGDGTPPVGTLPTTPPPSALTADEIAAAFKKAGVGQPQAAPATQSTKQYTQEDFDKAFNIFKPTPALRDAILAGGDGALAALAEVAQGVAKQVATLAAYQLQEAREQLEAKFSPALTYAQKEQEKALWAEFTEVNKDLKGFEMIVQKVVADMKTNGWKGTKEEGFKFIADQSRLIIKALPGMAAAQVGAAPGAAPTTRMSTLSGGGQGGAGNGAPAASKSKSPGQAVFS